MILAEALLTIVHVFHCYFLEWDKEAKKTILKANNERLRRYASMSTNASRSKIKDYIGFDVVNTAVGSRALGGFPIIANSLEEDLVEIESVEFQELGQESESKSGDITSEKDAN